MFHNIFSGCVFLKLLYFKFIDVQVAGGEIHIVFHFELTPDFSFYC